MTQILYEIRHGFPRLTADSFTQGPPPGVLDIGYALDMTACASWEVEDEPATESRLAALIRPA